jgi:formylglycine-generating enzyme required for sulfatase activity
MKRILQLGAMMLLAAWAIPAQAAIPVGMTLIPAGKFQPFVSMDPTAKPIEVSPFFLDILPATNGDFLEFVRQNPRWRRSAVKPPEADPDYLKTWAGDLDLGAAAATNAPVTYVTWFAAKAYAEWKGKRLPSTAEWECAAGASASRPDGENDPAFAAQVRRWYSTPAPAKIPAVAQNAPNFFGVHDLHGLIWEWVADFEMTPDPISPKGKAAPRDNFCGGGSAGAKDRDNFPAFMRYGFRSSLKPSYVIHNLGFRCALSLADQRP